MKAIIMNTYSENPNVRSTLIKDEISTIGIKNIKPIRKILAIRLLGKRGDRERLWLFKFVAKFSIIPFYGIIFRNSIQRGRIKFTDQG